ARRMGRPGVDRVRIAVKRFWGMTVMVVVALVPCAMVKLGDAETVKFGGGGTVRVIAIVFVKLPDVPVIVTVTVPVVAVLLAVSVNVLVLVAGVGLKGGGTPLGRPDAGKLTLSPEPERGVEGEGVVAVGARVMSREVGGT